MTVRWADSGPADVDLVVLLIGEDRRVRSDADIENPRSGAMSFHDMGPAWVAVRESVAAGTLRPADRKTAPVIEAWYRRSGSWALV